MSAPDRGIGMMLAFIGEAIAMLRDVDLDDREATADAIAEASRQIVAAQTLVKFFNSELTDTTIEAVISDLHTGFAVVNGRLFRVSNLFISTSFLGAQISLTLSSKRTGA